MQAQRDHCGRDRVERAADQQREREIAPDEHDEHGNGPHRVDVEAQDGVEQPGAVGPADGHQDAQQQSERAGEQADQERDPERLGQERPGAQDR